MRFTKSLLLSVIKEALSKKDLTVYDRDRVRLFLKAGAGGTGIARFNGVGGNGGCIFAKTSKNLTFHEFISKQQQNFVVKAENGEDSRQTKLAGRHGPHTIIEVPLGVEITTEDNVLIARCSTHKKSYPLARGGKGGCAATDYKPEKGDNFAVYVHLKLRPNIGIVGFPNAGKSTLMKALVPEKPIEISCVQFTTKHPQVCHLKFQEDAEETPTTESEKHLSSPSSSKISAHENFSLSIADLPGIVEGASQNSRKWLSFLKHLEFSDVIAMVVDVHGFQLASRPDEPYRTALETVALLNREMERYEKSLVRKPVTLLINKVDVGDGEQKAEELCQLFLSADAQKGEWVKHVQKEELRPRYPIRFRSVHAISAKQRQLGNFKETLREIYLQRHPKQRASFEEDYIEYRQKKQTLLI